MSGFGGAIKLTGESEYKKALKQITQNLKEVSSEMKVVTNQFGRNDTSVKALTAKQDALNNKLKEQTNKLNLIQTEYKRLSGQYEENTKRHNALVASYDKEKAELDRIEKELGESSKEYQEQKSKVDALAKEVAKSTTAQEANEKSMSDMRVEMNKAQAEVNKTTRELDNLEKQLQESTAAEKQAETETAKLGKSISDQETKLAGLKTAYKDAVLQYGKNSTQAKALAGDIERLSGELAQNKTKMSEVDTAADALDKTMLDVDKSTEKVDGGFTVLKGTLADLASAGLQKIAEALSSLASTSMQAWQEYDSGTDIVIAKTGATGKAADDLEDVFRSVSTQVVASQEDIGTAVGEVNTRFGVTGKDLDTLSTKFLKFAKLNGTDVNQSIDSTQKALSAFGLGADDAGHVLDVFNTVGQQTGVSMDTLMQGLIQNGTAFQQMGLNIDQATMLMGQMEKSGANSETVMNGLRKALKNAAADGIPLNEALVQLEDSIKNNTSETEGLNKAYEIFGKSGDQIYGALKNGTLSFKDLTAASIETKGSVEKTFENTQDGPEKMALAVQSIKTKMADMVDNLMEKYAPQIEKAIETILDVADKVFTGIEKGIGFIIKNGSTIITILKAMTAGLVTYLGYTTAITVMREGWMALTVVQKAVTAAQWLMNAAMSANPIGVVLSAVVALIAAFVMLWKKSETFRQFWITLWDSIKKVASDTWQAIVGIFSGAWEAIKGAWSGVKDFFSNTWKAIREIFAGVIGWFRDRFVGAWNAIKGAFASVKTFFSNKWKAIREVFAGVIGWFRERFFGAWEAIKGAFKNVGAFFSGIWETIKGKFTDIGTKVGDAIGGAFKKAINAVLATIEWVLNSPIRAINSLIDIVNSLGFNLGYLDEFNLPRLAQGGVLKRGQVGLLEGDGAEAVVPLEKNTQWIQRVADEMRMSLTDGMGNSGSMGGDEITINVYASQGMDVNSLALAVEQRLARVQKQRQEVWT